MRATFCAYDQPGYASGPNSWLRRLLPALRGMGVEPHVLCFALEGDGGPLVEALRAGGIHVSVVPWPRYTSQRVRWILARLVAWRPDVFVPNLMVSGFIAGRWARAAGIPTIAVMHSDDAFHRAVVEEFVLGDGVYRLSAAVCVSEFLADELLARRPDGTVVRRIPCGSPVPPGAASPPRQRLRLAYVGRLVEESKRISEVTRALCRVVREVPGTEAEIFGDGPARSAVERILGENGTAPVRLVGAVDVSEIQQRLLASHALVLLSDYEGLPIALTEAMACGVVPVCLAVRSGVAELVRDGVTGLLVRDRGDSLVAAVRRLAGEPGLWQQLSTAARELVTRGYSTASNARGWHELMRDLLRDAGPQAPLVAPRWLRLPRPHPALAREDRRRGELPGRALRRLRRVLGAAP